ncbi:MAG: DUF1351 domain-containing protein [Mediterranea sp.]|jgi:hypothetical protein|nr:DUF1351 domain-containing protein [Mediterranea sp.]
MSTEIVNIEIQEKDLELVVTEKTLGHLTTNARQIKTMIEQALPRYDIVNYNESNIELAKRDKSMLNNAAKLLNAKRIELEKEFVKPFQEFKDIVSDTVKLISECSAKIDTVVKQSDERARTEKRETIQKYWASKGFTLVTLDKVFDNKWLNKTEKMKNVWIEIDAKIAKINDDITTLEAIGEDVELLKSLYLDTLNINSTIQYANTLKQNRERAAAAKAEKAKREEETVKQEQADPIPQVNTTTQQAPATPVYQHVSQQPTLLTRAFKVTTTRENIIALGNFMNANGIDFDKIEL